MQKGSEEAKKMQTVQLSHCTKVSLLILFFSAGFFFPEELFQESIKCFFNELQYLVLPDNAGLNSLQCKNNDNHFNTFPVLNYNLETKP